MQAGDEIGGYQLIELIGAGAMGAVWLARHQVLERQVALKVIQEKIFGDENTERRFQREMRIQASLDHPHLVKVFDGGRQDAYSFLAMEYVPGPTLRKYLVERGRLPELEALRILAELASALSHLHQNRILHRDLKPENVLMGQDASPRITDFGLSRASGSTIMTGSNQLVGTPLYLPPEAFRGSEYTAAVDVYALGVIAFELLAGKDPFQAKSFTELVDRIAKGRRSRLRDFPDPPSSRVEELVDDCLALHPEDRPEASALDVRIRRLSKVIPAIRPAQVLREAQKAAQNTARVVAEDGNEDEEEDDDELPTRPMLPVVPRRRSALALVAGGAALTVYVLFVTFCGTPISPTPSPTAAPASLTASPSSELPPRAVAILEKYCREIREWVPLVRLAPPGTSTVRRDAFIRRTVSLLAPSASQDRWVGLFLLISSDARASPRLQLHGQLAGAAAAKSEIWINGVPAGPPAVGSTSDILDWRLAPGSLHIGLNVVEIAGMMSTAPTLSLAELGSLPDCEERHSSFPSMPRGARKKYDAMAEKDLEYRFSRSLGAAMKLKQEVGEHPRLACFIANARMMMARNRFHVGTSQTGTMIAEAFTSVEAAGETAETEDPPEVLLARGAAELQSLLPAHPDQIEIWLMLSRILGLGELREEALACARLTCIRKPLTQRPWMAAFRVADDMPPPEQPGPSLVHDSLEGLEIALELKEDPFTRKSIERFRGLMPASR